MANKLVEYLDWSDNGLEKHENGQGASKFAELTFWHGEDYDLTINLRRNTANKRDFTFFIANAKEIYEILKERYGEAG